MKPVPVLLIFLALPVFLFCQKKIFVHNKAKGANNGTSWADAYTDLSRALTNASDADVYIAEGIYHPRLSFNGMVPADPRTATFNINGGVRLKGGYRVSGNRAEWDGSYKTILSGDLGRNDAGTLANPLFFDPNRQENIFQLLYFGSRTKAFRQRRFEHIEFTGANNATGSFLMDYQMTTPESIGFFDCLFYLNVGMDGLILRNNVLNDPGGLVIDSCRFEQNYATRLGWLSYLNLDSRNCTFINTYSAHSFFFDNYNLNSKSFSIAFSKCFFFEPSLTVSTFRFEGGPGTSFGVYDSKFYIKAALLDYSKESLTTQGTTIDNVRFHQCLVSKDNSFPSSMVRLNVRNTASIIPVFDYCTINSYPATTLPFMTVNITQEMPYPTVYTNTPIGFPGGFKHCIVWGYNDELIWETITGQPLQNWWHVELNDLSAPNGNALYITYPGWHHNMFSNPLFIAPFGSDGLAGTPDDNLHLQFDFFQGIVSPPIDAGLDTLEAPFYPFPDFDLDGNNRVQGIIDLGCYERCRCILVGFHFL